MANLSGLFGGSHTSPLALALAQKPPAQPLVAPEVAKTDVLGAYRDSYNQQMETYKAELARNNAMWGGLAGLGGAGINAFGPSIGSGIGSMFGGAGAAAGGMESGAEAAALAAEPAAEMAAAEAIPFLLPFAFSDRRLKTDIERVGALHNGLPVYRFRYRGDPIMRIGLMADDVEKRDPDAVHDVGGFKAVDYARATER